MATIPLKDITFPGLDNTYTIPEIDSTLSTAGKAADAKKTGDEISDLKEDINNIDDAVYIYDSMISSATASGWRLNESDGCCSSNSSYKLVKYAVTVGDKIRIISDDRFQFQTSATVPSGGTNNRVGDTTYGTGTYVLTVPETATYLIVSTLATDSDASVAHIYNALDDVFNTTGVLPKEVWVYGGINSSTGALTYSSKVTYITPSFIDKRIAKIKPNSGYYVAVFAYSKGEYVGIYDGTSFAKTYTVRTVDVDLNALRVTYPAYDFKLLIGKLDATDNAIRENIIFIYDNRTTESSIAIEDVQRTIDQARFMRGGNGSPLTLLHFSDIHGDKDRLEDIISFSTLHSANINDVVCTGDIVDGQYSDGIDFWTNVNGAENILTCIGNHDAVTAQTGGTLIDMSTLCDTFISPFISNWGTVVHPTNATYYYKDYADSAVRLIILDVMHSDAAQLSWLQSALNDAKTNNLDVIIGIHYPAYPRTVIKCSFSSAKDLGNYDTATIPDDILSAVDAFQTNGGNFVCYLTGHEHSDFILTPQNYPNQLVISITCASNVFGQWKNSDQYRFNNFSNAFNLVTIDTQSKIFTVKRIGADMDKFLRDRKTFCYDYGTSTLLS